MTRSRSLRPAAEADLLARVLEAGLATVVVLAPLPFGAVVAGGRGALEAGALVLLVIWLVRAMVRPPVLPSPACCIGIAGLLVFATLQTLPVHAALASALSPLSAAVRRESVPEGGALAAERRLLGIEPSDLDPHASLSVDREATASALRTGAALSALFLVACTVVASRGARTLALALLVSAAFQGLYGTLVLASGQARIWHLPKKYYLDSATGTFVNRNHFAGLLAASLPAGLALALRSARGVPGAESWRGRVVHAFGAQGAKALALGVLVALGLAGLFLSFSRAGIALGLAALALTVLALGRRGLRVRVLAIALLLVVGAVPIAQVGADRLARRYALAGDDLSSPTGRATVWGDTLRMIRASPVVGVGFGSFDAAYPLFRSPQVRPHYDHAHNDALQAVAEGGFVGAVLLLLLVGSTAVAIVRALTGDRGTLPIGLAAGLTAMLLHALVDFGFHIPSNAAIGSILAGALQGAVWKSRS